MHISKKIFKNPWFIGVGSSILGFIIIRIIDAIFGSKILLSLWRFFSKIFTSIIHFLNLKFEWPLYGLILLFISGPIIGLLILLIDAKIQRSREKPLPKWYNYRRDTFDGVEYRWDWGKDYAGKYEIRKLCAYCTNCGCVLIGGSCPNCNSKYFMSLKSEDEIKALIYYRIENMD